MEEVAWDLSRQALLDAEPSDRPQRIASFYADLLAKVMGVSAAQIEIPLLSLGLDSIMGVDLYRHTESTLGVAIPLEEFPGLTASRFTTLVLEQLESPPSSDVNSAQSSQPSLGSSARTVAGKLPRSHGMNPVSDQSCIVRFKPQSEAKFRLFCFPYAGAGASIFRSWAEALPSEIEVCALQLPGREDRLGEAPFTRFAPLVQALVPIIQPYLDLPFTFFGHSMGALVSFELVRELRRQGCPSPAHLLVSALRAPQLPDLNLPIHRLPEPKFIEALQQLKGTPEGILQNADLMQLLSPTIRADLAIAENYIYSAQDPLACPITAFGGQADSIVRSEELAGWKEQTLSSFRLQLFPGDHFFLHRDREDLLKAIVEELTQPLSVKS